MGTSREGIRNEIRKALEERDYAKAKNWAEELIEADKEDSIAWANLSVVARAEGKTKKAIEYLESAIAYDPKFAQAYNNLALLYSEIGESLKAIDTLLEAIQKCGERADLRNSLGNIYQKINMPKEAIEEYSKAVAIDGQFGQGHLNRAIVYEEMGLVKESLVEIQQSLQIEESADAVIAGYRIYKKAGLDKEARTLIKTEHCPRNLSLGQNESLAEAYLKEDCYTEAFAHYSYLAIRAESEITLFNLGCCLEKMKQYEEAKKNYYRSLKIAPKYINSLVNLGNLELEMENSSEAVILLQEALGIDNTCMNGHFSIADAYYRLEDYDASREHYQRCIEADFQSKWSLLRLGNICYRKNDFKNAEAYYRQALETDPNLCDAWFNLGILLHELELYRDAELCFAKQLALEPSSPEANLNLGHQQQLQGKLLEAIESYKKELHISPTCSTTEMHLLFCELSICYWEKYEGKSEWLKDVNRCGAGKIAPWLALSITDDPREELLIAENYAKRNGYTRKGKIKDGTQRNNTGKIAVGFFSSDFYNHATLYLIEVLFREINEQEFEVFLYDYGRHADSITEKLISKSRNYRNVKDLSDDSIVTMARNDNLSVAVDLKGYTSGARPELFCLPLAPVHISYLGYPGTSGSNMYEYIIGDRIVAPRSLHQYYSEKVLMMNGCYQPNNPCRDIDTTYSSRESNGLPIDKYVYCCFNASYKIKPHEFEIWMNILSKTESVLWVLRSNRYVDENLKEAAGARGIDPGRIMFTGKLGISLHLGRHQSADLQLDTFNVNAHTTASDSIFAGLPILTKMGRTFSSRVCASILIAAGLEELITYSDGEYEERAIYMGNNPAYTEKIKTHIKDTRESMLLFDIKSYAREFERSIKRVLA